MGSHSITNILRRRVEAKRGGIAGAKMLTELAAERNLDFKSEYVSSPAPRGRPPKSIERSKALQIKSEVEQGKPIRRIARDHVIDRRTLTRWIDSGRLDLLAMG